MPITPLHRRGLLMGALAVTTLPGMLRAAAPEIHVLKDRNCGCCSSWVKILRQEGFAVTTEDTHNAALIRYKMDNGIPPKMASCHTARIEGYLIEGHVPAADIRRLLEERPEARGLAVPGMPYGSPGMGPEDEREAYDVHLILRDGTTRVFTHYDAA
ncbi:MAG: DUF411 domain-containing protein [Mameliella sp.]|uniref:DUF411 domain-containing protein n=1 Tax=Mameliella sp. AT18 TaxID=3028385 RepID=UPI00084119B3|nr:DUF411 domain-containing protein [Mameliella sp.]ODM48776.1 metal-binding protein [Ruegeria sp. PBVC088]